MPDQPFAIITFRDTGPLKSFVALRGANVHNTRATPVKNAVEGAPPPKHLIGTGDLVRDVKAKLERCGINPAKLRKNGVIAYEAVLTASPEFFAPGTKDEREARLDAWVRAQVEFAVERYGRHRIASMVLHLDEKTPHIHLVVLPLEVKSDKRRKDRSARWGLNGRTISGPGQFDQVLDDYADAMAPFGLVRGVRHSGAKNEPPAIFMARMAEQQRQLDERQAHLDQSIAEFARMRVAVLGEDDRRRKEVDAEMEKARALAAEIIADAQRFVRETNERNVAAGRAWALAQADRDAAARDRAAAKDERTAADLMKAESVRLADIIAAARSEVAEQMAGAKAERIEARNALVAANDVKAEVEKDRARLHRGMSTVIDLYDRAKEVRAALIAMPKAERPAPAVAVAHKAVAMVKAASVVTMPDVGLTAAQIATFRHMQQMGAGR